MLRQRRELAELIGFETRNKYALETGDGRPLDFAAEHADGLLGMVARHFLGHWRRFELVFFDAERRPVVRARHPFRWFFQRLDIEREGSGAIGALQQRWAPLSKRFDVLDAHGQLLFEVRSPFWRLWTFPFTRGGQQRACIQKRWAGTLGELFTDADSFRVTFDDGALSADERLLVLAAAVFVDLQYFEKKAS